MSDEIRKSLGKLIGRSSGNVMGNSRVLRKNYEPEIIEERREEALNFLVNDYFEKKKTEEEYLKKIQSHGVFIRWLYKSGRSVRNGLVFIRETIVRPTIIAIMLYSTALSLYLGIRVGSEIARLTGIYFPFPLNNILDVLIIFPIGFSPGILSITLGYFVEKKKIERVIIDYGISM
ncbi:MAG: hypothetical protein PVF96_05820 [Candidatus Bathyarchaeota archaeon]|jgi:hypothetical protein